MVSFAKIENIVNELSADLSRRGFSKVEARENEVVRYAKQGGPICFQVGLTQEHSDSNSPEWNTISLALSYDYPKGFSEMDYERINPNSDLMESFYTNSPICHSGLYLTKDIFQDGRMNLIYSIDFKKDKNTAVEMRAVLREFIDYVANYITVNVQMLVRTESFDE